MKQDLPGVMRNFIFLALICIHSNLGLAQASQPAKGIKYKTAAALRELQPQATSANARTNAIKTEASNFRKLNALQIKDNYVAIDAVSNLENGQELLQQLQQLGLKNGSVYGRMVSGFFPIGKIDKLETISQLNSVAPAYAPLRNSGKVESQGNAAIKADVVQKMYRLTGVGSKIGILSDTYGADADGVAAGIASGDLPGDVQILSDFDEGTDEGRAMAETVHDVAPGAKIAFHSAYPGQAAFANGIINLAEAGCNIIMDDIQYYFEPMFQDGIVAQAVNEVVKKNVTYFSAAGNQARQSYQAGFKNSGKSVVMDGVDYGVAHDFGHGDISQTIHIPAGGVLQMPFQWDDPFYSVSGGTGARTDLDLLVFYNGILLTSLSSMSINVGGDPVESIGFSAYEAIDIEIVITKYSGPDPKLIKWVNYGNAYPVEYNTNSSTLYGHANAEGAIAVGASAWYNKPIYHNNVKVPVINSFSSLGGTPVVISADGNYTGTISSKVRNKPTLVGPDGGNTTFFGFDILEDADSYPNFLGTSAATPHVAGVAALLQELNQTPLTPAAVQDLLVKTALDMDDPGTAGFDVGYDALTGWGFVQADKALEMLVSQNCTAGGTILREQYNVSDLSGKPLVSSLTSFEANNKGDYFTARILGYICPPQTGNYTFWISGDDATRLLLSTNDDPAKAQLIAYNTSRTNFREYKKYATQKSAPIYLQAGRKYYIEAQHAEFWAGDHVTVAWQMPDGKFEGPIAGAHLSPYVTEEASPATLALAPLSSRIADKSELAVTHVTANKIVAAPNPFADKTTVSFSAEEDGELTVDIFSAAGGLIKTLHQGKAKSGTAYQYTFDGGKYASGIYICRVTLNGKTEYKRVALIK